MSSGHQSEKLKVLKNVWGGGNTTTSREMNQNWQKRPKRYLATGCVRDLNLIRKLFLESCMLCYFY